MAVWRDLNEQEEHEFRQWARENYVAGSEINSLWHPVVKEECNKINSPDPSSDAYEHEGNAP